jgi:hypothetical protein
VFLSGVGHLATNRRAQERGGTIALWMLPVLNVCVDTLARRQFRTREAPWWWLDHARLVLAAVYLGPELLFFATGHSKVYWLVRDILDVVFAFVYGALTCTQLLLLASADEPNVDYSAVPIRRLRLAR